MLVDSWGRKIEYVRLSLTEACNFCCPYCRPEEITVESQTHLLHAKEWLVILEAFALLGVKALRLTGGEPLLYPELKPLLQALQARQWFADISMTTNGSLLAAHAEALHALGLQRVNISLDAVDEDTFAERTGRSNQLQPVLAGIEKALRVGFGSVKINTVLMEPLSDEAVKTLLTYIEKWPVIWRFIEYMPFQGDHYKGASFAEWKTQLERIVGAALEPVTEKLGYGPATYYQLPSGKRVGFIFPMSHSYCDSCNRVRLTSDGKLRLCLLRDDEGNLAEAVRRGESASQIGNRIKGLLQLRHEQHAGENTGILERPMWRIGG